MKLSEIFPKVTKDFALIKITNNKIADAKIDIELKKRGWEPKTVTQFVPYGDMPAVVVKQEVTRFRKGDHIQGDTEWYRDLSSICSPGHKPGLLTYILG